MTSTPRELRKLRESEQRREAIIECARTLIQQGGLGGISLRKVAELAGFSTTVVYSLFADKASLVTQAMDKDVLAMTQALSDAAKPHTDPLMRFRAVGWAYLQFGLKHPAEYSFMFLQLRRHSPNNSSRVRHGDPSQDPYAFLRAEFLRLRSADLIGGGEEDIDLMAQITWEAMHGMTSRLLVLGEKDPWLPDPQMERHFDVLNTAIMTGLQAQFPPRKALEK